MLKIKDGINLKELEKFGFKKISPSWYSLTIRDNAEEEIGIAVSLFAIPRCIEIGYSTKGNGGMSSLTYDLDVIFDLIKADMVEKVVEDE